MVGLHLIKHMDGLSDEAVCGRFRDSPSVQLFCGETHVQHALPLERSSMTRRRKRIGPERLELLLAETLATAERAGAAEAVRAAFATPLARITQLLRQRREDRRRDKIDSLHAPEVACIGKGKARTRFEFGVTVSLATINRPAPVGQVVIGARTLPGNPCDGHTLAAQIAQTGRITGLPVARAHVDRGYRGHDAGELRSGKAHKGRGFVSGQKCCVTPTIRREIRRRAGIEPVIGHMKQDGHLGRNFLAGATDDAITLVLAAAGHNLRLLRAWLRRLLAFLLSLLAISARPATKPSPQLATHGNRILHRRRAALASLSSPRCARCPRRAAPGVPAP